VGPRRSARAMRARGALAPADGRAQCCACMRSDIRCSTALTRRSGQASRALWGTRPGLDSSISTLRPGGGGGGGGGVRVRKPRRVVFSLATTRPKGILSRRAQIGAHQASTTSQTSSRGGTGSGRPRSRQRSAQWPSRGHRGPRPPRSRTRPSFSVRRPTRFKSPRQPQRTRGATRSQAACLSAGPHSGRRGGCATARLSTLEHGTPVTPEALRHPRERPRGEMLDRLCQLILDFVFPDPRSSSRRPATSACIAGATSLPPRARSISVSIASLCVASDGTWALEARRPLTARSSP